MAVASIALVVQALKDLLHWKQKEAHKDRPLPNDSSHAQLQLYFCCYGKFNQCWPKWINTARLKAVLEAGTVCPGKGLVMGLKFWVIS